MMEAEIGAVLDPKDVRGVIPEHEQAREIHNRIEVLNRLRQYDRGYVLPCKFALNNLGYAAGRVRRPLPELTQTEQDRVLEAQAELGFQG